MFARLLRWERSTKHLFGWGWASKSASRERRLTRMYADWMSNGRPVVSELHHVQLAMPADGEAAAEDFYEGILGIPRVAKPAHLDSRGGCWFEDGSVRIHLGVESDFTPARKAHPALMINDLNTLKSVLEEAGVEVVEDQPLPGFDRLYVSDPFGNRLEFLQPTGSLEA